MTVRSGGPRRAFRLSPDVDSSSALHFFCILLQQAADAEQRYGRKFEVRPGTLLVWGRKGKPSARELLQAPFREEAPAGWPKIAAGGWQGLQGGVFLTVLRYAVEHAPEFSVDAAQLCRLLAGVAQTQLTDDSSLRQANLRLAEKYRQSSSIPDAVAASALKAKSVTVRPQQPSPLVPAQPYRLRIDESGGFAVAQDLQASFASCAGPSYPAPTQNEDACYALAEGNFLVFALADGVGTSVGARFAAAASSFVFCRELANSLAGGAEADGEVLAVTLKRTQSYLDEMLSGLLFHWKSRDFPEVYGDMQRETTERILENTRNPTRRWPPALATTFLGGFVCPAADGFRGYLLRLGDGVAELVDGDRAQRLVDMDSEVTRISGFLGPGPRSKAALSEQLRILPVMFKPWQRLLISSDGLSRGHKLPVWTQLRTMVPTEILCPRDYPPDYATQLLQSAAQYADHDHEVNPASSLFADNLSLIFISGVKGRPRHVQ